MTEQHELSLFEAIEQDPRGAVELAVADWSVRLEELFHAAIDVRDTVSASDLAGVVGVTEERVMTLISGDEEITPEAAVRYLRALGYKLTVNAHALGDAPALPEYLHQWVAARVDTYRHHVVGAAGVGEMAVKVVWPLEPTEYTALNEPKLVQSETFPEGHRVTAKYEVRVAAEPERVPADHE